LSEPEICVLLRVPS